MGVDVGIAQLCGYPVLQSLRDIVLQAFRFFVNFIPGIVQEIVKKSFQEAMMAHNLECTMLPGRPQKHAMMLLIVNPGGFVVREFLKHARYRGGTDAESFCKRIASDPFFLRAAQFEDCFEIIVDRFGGWESLRLR